MHHLRTMLTGSALLQKSDSCTAIALGRTLCTEYTNKMTPHSNCVKSCAEKLRADFFLPSSERWSRSSHASWQCTKSLMDGTVSFADLTRALCVPYATPAHLTRVFALSTRLLDHDIGGKSSCSARRGLVLPVLSLTHAIVGATCQPAALTCEACSQVKQETHVGADRVDLHGWSQPGEGLALHASRYSSALYKWSLKKMATPSGTVKGAQ